MKITKRQLRRIIKEEKQRLREQAAPAGDELGVVDGSTHHWPRVEWTNVEDLVDQWMDQENKAFDKGDPSMMRDDEISVSEAKAIWEDQVEAAAMDMEAEMTVRVRKLALQTMQEFTEKLIDGQYGR
jgi:hypothetical protein